MTTFIAVVIAVPLGLGAAIYLAELASGPVRRVLKPAIEVLAGVPTVVYGYFALTMVTPTLQGFVPGLSTYILDAFHADGPIRAIVEIVKGLFSMKWIGVVLQALWRRPIVSVIIVVTLVG